ncbi:ATP-binding protein [Thermobifida halotolerans]|uniref:ATP-binding protein n=1 Tax=Thermobifida halotolerans TaxID=483545 RepID=A0A399G3B5_9ACTN|nr:ATP-binding protein [Thermobifida halotolerans]UOE19489.1 ATP-binding protein [Thermobifida halotolerans]
MAVSETPGSGAPHSTEEGTAVPEWWIFHGTGRPRPHLDLAAELPPPPRWRTYGGGPHLPPPPPVDEDEETGRVLGVAPTALAPRRPLGENERARLSKVNAALYLRRPLLVQGPPGVGKSALAAQLARELNLGRVLRWTVDSRSTLRSGVYDYDPISQIHDLNLESVRCGPRTAADRRYAPTDEETAHLRSSAQRIGRYLRLGPLGTAFLPYRLPRVLLIEGLDRGDYDLATDLLTLLERGGYTIPELHRLRTVAPEITVPTNDPRREATITDGEVRCSAFPVVVITCGTERPFPPEFLRRCIPVEHTTPTGAELADIVAAHFSGGLPAHANSLITDFLRRGAEGSTLAVDQLLNAVHLATVIDPGADGALDEDLLRELSALLWHRLTDTLG